MRILKVLGKVLLVLVLGVLVLETAFRLAGFLAREDRGTEGLQAGHFVVLCIGDSHTWGLGKGYPARLAERLGQEDPRYRVINMGVPASNTAQVRKRLPGYLERFQPDLVVLWAGVNNKYNRAESDDWQEVGVEQASLGRSLLDSSRTIRFFRLWQNERELNRFLEAEDAYVKPDDGGGAEFLPVKEGEPFRRYRRGLMGETYVFEHVRGDNLPPDQMAEVTELDVRRIAETIRARGIPLIVVTYPIEMGWLLEANRGIRAAASATGTEVVESKDVLEELKADYLQKGIKFDKRTFFDSSVHPQQVLFDAIGDQILKVAKARGYLPESGESAAATPRDASPEPN